MASAQASVIHRASNMKVALGDGERVRWGRPETEVFANNPRLATQADVDRGEAVVWCHNWSGHRPYIDREAMESRWARLHPGEKFTMKHRSADEPWIWTDWKISDVGPGEIYFSAAEMEKAKHWTDGNDFVVIEPGVKNGASPNKAWLNDRWEEVARHVAKQTVLLQFNAAHPLPGAITVTTKTFREAAAILSHARLYIGVEGGLHHAAAALDVPGVVYFGGYISPQTTGYSSTRPLYRGDACGMRTPCDHCKKIARDITADEMVNLMGEL